MTTVTLEWAPRADYPNLIRDTMTELDLITGNLARSFIGFRVCQIELDIEGDERAVHAAVDQARNRLKRFAEGGVVRWLQPKE